MEEPTKVKTFLSTQPSKKYIKTLIKMAVFLEYVEINDDKINELIKKKIIIKSAVSVKEECLRADILRCYNII